MSSENAIIPVERVESRILVLWGRKVILDADLARFYGVPTKRLNEAVKRNQDRFPPDFLFQLTDVEKTEVVASCDHLRKLKFSPVLPYAYTEHGAIMAATVLNSPQAVRMSVLVVRAFVKMREALVNYHELVRKLAELERRLTGHDEAIRHLFDVIRQLLAPPEPSPEPPRKQIGFHIREGAAAYRVRAKRTTR